MGKTDQWSEIEVLRVVDDALSRLEDGPARVRVLAWIRSKYASAELGDEPKERRVTTDVDVALPPHIHPTAALWLKRNGLASDERLARVFSFDLDDIDLVASQLPGTSTKARMRSVFLMRGVCGYLKSGEFRFDDQQARITCRHYAAYDANNWAHYVKGMQDEVSGSKDTGYVLTPRGQRAATELIRSLS